MAQISFISTMMMTLMDTASTTTDLDDDYATLSARIEELEEENKLLDEMLSSS